MPLSVPAPTLAGEPSQASPPGRLLEREGYHVRHLEAPLTGLIEELLEGVDVLLLAPGLKDGVREAFLKAMRSTQEKSAAIPVLPLSSALKLALLDELSAGASWRTLFEELTSQIGAALGIAATRCTRALGVEDHGAAAQPLPPAAPEAGAL